MANIAVIGAGVVGLSTAINIQKVIPGSKVKVIAAEFDNDTTTYGCGGMFFPRQLEHPAGPVASLRKWFSTSFQHYQQLVSGSEASKCGAMMISGYYISKTPKKELVFKESVFNYRELSEIEMKQLNFPAIYKYGYSITSLVFNPAKYLKWLRECFQTNGGEVEQRHVQSLGEFVGKYDVVVNCTGLGSRTLVGDDNVYPIRGQIVKIKAPWIKHWLYTDDNTYILPSEENVGLGGLHQINNFNLKVNLNDTKDIIERCERVSPNIKGATVDHAWVGLRPGRDTLRLESHVMQFDHGKLKVVHNYGHGTSGLALSWGTAVDAAQLVQQMMSYHEKSKL